MLAPTLDPNSFMPPSRWLAWLPAAALALVTLSGCTEQPTHDRSDANGLIEIDWWHSMGGALGEEVDSIAQGFNASQPQFRINAIFKGGYSETMNGAVAAFRAGEQPHIVQIYEVGTATMMAAEGAIYPVWQLMRDMEVPLESADYLPAILAYYADSQGRLISMPFNSSTPVVYYNKGAFKKAGLDPLTPPATWPQLEQQVSQLLQSGMACGFTTAWQSWVQIENFGTWHNIPFATRSNGFDGLDTELLINREAHVKHIAQLARWQEKRIFVYGGRSSQSSTQFYNGDCAIYMNSSAAYAGIQENVTTFEFGVGFLPYWPDLIEEPQNSIIGGASLWTFRGHGRAEYEGIAQFYAYLTSREVQARWHQSTGYLPVTFAAYELTQADGFYQRNPGTEVAIKQLTRNSPTAHSRGLRFGSFVQIRDTINAELEAVWAGKKSAREALDEAVERGNVLLRRFEHANRKR